MMLDVGLDVELLICGVVVVVSVVDLFVESLLLLVVSLSYVVVVDVIGVSFDMFCSVILFFSCDVSLLLLLVVLVGCLVVLRGDLANLVRFCTCWLCGLLFLVQGICRWRILERRWFFLVRIYPHKVSIDACCCFCINAKGAKEGGSIVLGGCLS